MTTPHPRFRFAPSPTGYLHIGGARTALFNWLLARKLGGTFVLRIEDTDQARSTGESVNAILDAMKWMGLDWDEGPGVGGECGPYFQMQRLPIYKQYAEKLIASGKAYRCWTTKAEMDALREQAKSEGKPAFKFDSPWRDRTDGPMDEPYVVRFKMPRDDGAEGFDDLVYGYIEKKHSDLDDWVMLRSDGVPTYNFGVVIDDHTMGITTVARGDDHVNNTPMHVGLYKALGAPLPQYAHLPMILGADKARLSKRHGAVSVTNYRDDGYLPDALVNYLARLGWSHGDQEIFTRAELIEHFGFDHVGRTAGVFNPEKLQWVNNQWMKNEGPDALVGLYREQLAREGLEEPDSERAKKLLALYIERQNTLSDVVKAAHFFYVRGVTIDEKAGTKHLLGQRELLEKVRERAATGTFEAGALEEWFNHTSEELGVKLGKMAQPVRVAVTGTAASPSLFETLELIGQDETVRRLDEALVWIGEKSPPAA